MRHFLTNLLSVILAPSAATRRQRRALGAAVLIVVILMVLLGGFYLKAGVAPGTSLLFWGACLLLMGWSVFLAYVDVKSIKHEFRAQRKKLFFSTFSRAGFEKDTRQKERSQPPSGETSEPRDTGGRDRGERE